MARKKKEATVLDVGEDAGAAADGPEPAEKKRKGRPKQLKIAGTERQGKIKELERAASEYYAVMSERVGLSNQEGQLKKRVGFLMKENKLTTYNCDDEDLVITLKVTEEKVKVKRVTDDEDEDDDE